MASKNLSLLEAKDAKDDEWYTLYGDIEKEVSLYKSFLIGRTVFCNCDDPVRSNFFRYFARNFGELGLKRLICSGYRFRHKDLLAFLNDEEGLDPAVWCELSEPLTYDQISGTDWNAKFLDFSLLCELNEYEEDGDFRSWESVKLLRESDVVVTNPPFSLFRDFVDQLVQYKKDYLVLGNMNGMTYGNCVPLVLSGKMFLGVNAVKDFIRTDGTIESLGFVRWFTNMDCGVRRDRLKLECRYDPEKYSKYDNYDAIEVGELKRIPYDYDGVMGVPVSIFDGFCKEQFELVGISDALWLDGRQLYTRVFIRLK